MITDKGHQCDCCNKYAEKGDEFFKFCCTSIASASDPRIPARLLLCFSCQPKIAKCFHIVDGRQKSGGGWSKIDPSVLPPGRLRRILEKIKSRSQLRDLHLF